LKTDSFVVSRVASKHSVGGEFVFRVGKHGASEDGEAPGSEGNEGRQVPEDGGGTEAEMEEGADLRDVSQAEDLEESAHAQVPTPQRTSQEQAGPLRGAQVSAYHGVGHEEDRGQQHFGVHRRRSG